MCHKHPTIKFEFTAPNTPQQNGVVERAFATIYNRVRAMFANANIDGELRNSLWDEAAYTATILENILQTPNHKTLPNEL
jgi:hypothetical protein